MDERKDPVVFPVDIESVKIVEATVTFSSRLTHEVITYSKWFANADVVAVVEITRDVKTYVKPFRHTLYKARVLRLIKGAAPDLIDIYQLDGYHPKTARSRIGFFVHGETDPLLMPGERGLFFMRKWDMKDALKHSYTKKAPHGDVYVPKSMCLKLEEDGKLYSIDNYNEKQRWSLQRDEEAYARWHVEGVTVEAFIKRMGGKL